MENISQNKQPQEKEHTMEKNCTAEFYDPVKEPWVAVRDAIMRIETEEGEEEALDEGELAHYFTDPKSTTVFLREEGTRRIVGYTNAVSAEGLYDEEFYPERGGDPHTAYIMDTAIEQTHRGQHLVGKLMAALEAELKRKGYTHIERDAATDNRYAENIQKAYGERILFSEPHDSEYGPQVFFRIKL